MEERDQRILEQAQRLIRAGELERAELELARIDQVLPTEALLARAQIAYLRRDLDGSGRLLEQVLAAAPDHSRALAYLAGVRFDQGRPGESLELARRACEHDPRFVPALFNQGRALGVLGQLDEAIQVLGQAVAVDPGCHAARFELTGLLHRAGRSREALLAAADLVERRPFDEPIYQLLCQIYLDLGQPGRARELLEKVLATHPLLPGLQLLLAEILLRTGATDTLAQRLPQLREICWDDPDRLCELGLLHTELQQHEAAEADWSRVLELVPEHPVALFRLGSLWAATNQPDQARAALSRAVAQDPSAWEARNSLALLLLSTEGADGAREALRLLAEAEAAAPLEPAPALNRGLAHLGLGEVAEATAALNKVLKLTDPSHPQHRTAAELLTRLGAEPG